MEFLHYKVSLKEILTGTFLLLFNFSYLFGQVYEKEYIPLASFGEVPADFVKSSKEKYEESKTLISEEDPKKQKKVKNKFFIHSTYSLDKIIFGGKVSFGDPITNYINEVAAVLLQNEPDLKQELRFYTLRSNAVNATCTSPGMIFVNIGLIAKLDNEAQLAFVLGHEISHYKENHLLDFYLEQNDAKEGEGKYNRTPYDKRIDNLTKYSRDHESDADSIGIGFIMASDYNNGEILEALAKLHYSYLPYWESEFPADFFNNKSLEIPECFFSSQFDPISEITAEYDRYSTHPNIKTRLAAAERLIKNAEGENFLVSEEKFVAIRNMARFENVRQQLFSGNYGDAIFSAHLLLKDYPDNKFLKLSVAKALYGLTKYKNRKEFHRVARSFSSIEGTAQQVHYFLRQLNQKQLNSLALSYILDLIDQFPNDNYLTLLKEDLVTEMVVYADLNFDDYYNSSTEVKTPEKTSYEAYLKTGSNNRSLLLKAQNEQKEFYKQALIGKKDQYQLKELFSKAVDKRNKIDNYQDLDYKERVKINKEKKQKQEKDGFGIKASKLLLLDPYYIVYAEDENKHVEAFDKKNELNRLLEEGGKAHDVKVNMFSSCNLATSDLDKYNRLCVFKEWLQDKYIHETLNMIPSNHDVVQQYVDKEFKLMSYTGVFLNFNRRIGKYYLDVFDLETGKKKYEYSDQIALSVKTRDLEKIIKENYTQIKK